MITGSYYTYFVLYKVASTCVLLSKAHRSAAGQTTNQLPRDFALAREDLREMKSGEMRIGLDQCPILATSLMVLAQLMTPAQRRSAGEKGRAALG